MWQLDFSEFETTAGGTWRLAGCRDYWSKYEHRFHVSPTANQFDAIDAVELALAEYEELHGRPMVADCPVDPDTGELLPVVTIVTDRVPPACGGGSRERGFGTVKYERLFIDEIDDAVMLAKHAEEYRLECNEVRPHEAIAWNRPTEVHLGLADPTTPTFQSKEILPTT